MLLSPHAGLGSLALWRRRHYPVQLASPRRQCPWRRPAFSAPRIVRNSTSKRTCNGCVRTSTSASTCLASGRRGVPFGIGGCCAAGCAIDLFGFDATAASGRTHVSDVSGSGTSATDRGESHCRKHAVARSNPTTTFDGFWERAIATFDGREYRFSCACVGLRYLVSPGGGIGCECATFDRRRYPRAARTASAGGRACDGIFATSGSSSEFGRSSFGSGDGFRGGRTYLDGRFPQGGRSRG